MTYFNVQDEVEKAIKANPCYAEYKVLEDCLAETNRNFKACQPAIKALQACSQKK